MGNKDRFSDPYRRIVDGLIAARKSRKLTQGDVAARMGTDQSQVSKLERGERRVDVIDYVRYCRAVGLVPGALLDAVDGEGD
ncbi:putative Helix-turn-helix DNA binding protein [Nitrospirillum viridazoti Y2]|uniref:Helix-turn-helix protein n=1 Tax=Nitrospirillum amazonense TaxID=28077 RepID=A0A560IC40_9PROT|nr:helix-turn-helix transcriptional regulator [Nitrospirillum amazonense]EGY00461.1 putative Helix-turn-helix DNA binding protein [Nitrospirillum amazonense Y2]TWB56617.1 helix-turn-helix protein [Nitrospirillum amazonense]